VHVRARAGCGAVAFVAAAVALLQPAWGEGEDAPAAPDVVLCLDVSRSMAARDQAPSRLAAAQQQIDRLAAASLGTRLALVVFAGDARLLVPLTSDAVAVAAVAATLAPGAAGRGGSDLGAAIDTALAALRRARSVGGSIVVLSDGEDFGGAGIAAAARARAADVPVYCLGLGSVAGSKLVVDGPVGEVFVQDASGADVVTHLDAEGLAAIAAAGGGSYGPVTTVLALQRLHDAELAPRALAATVRAGAATPAHRYQWFLLAAIGCWMLRRWLPEGCR
jgi:Ca-activated chloride channel family protein